MSTEFILNFLRFSSRKTMLSSIAWFAAGLAFLYAVYLVGKTLDIPYKKFTGDPPLTFDASPFIGVVSNLGVLLWCMTATACVLGSVLLWNISKMDARFLALSGLGNSILLLDDLFMFHDHLLYEIGLSQKPMYILYVLMFGLYFFFYRERFFQANNTILLLVAAGFLGGSVALDVLTENEGIQYLFEDGAKFLGIIAWFLFYWNYTSTLLRNRLQQEPCRENTSSTKR